MSDKKYGTLYTEADMRKFALELLAMDEERGPAIHRQPVAHVTGEVIERIKGDLTFPPDEPLFLLRGKDLSAPGAILFYSQVCDERGAPESHVEAATDASLAMTDWQNEHPDRTKVPDTD